MSELMLKDEDLQIPMTMALVMSGTWLDLMRLKNYIEKMLEFRVIYNTISTAHLRVVSIEDFESFQAWKKSVKIEKKM